jgi:hypothetical protein
VFSLVERGGMVRSVPPSFGVNAKTLQADTSPRTSGYALNTQA